MCDAKREGLRNAYAQQHGEAARDAVEEQSLLHRQNRCDCLRKVVAARAEADAAAQTRSSWKSGREARARAGLSEADSAEAAGALQKAAPEPEPAAVAPALAVAPIEMMEVVPEAPPTAPAPEPSARSSKPQPQDVLARTAAESRVPVKHLSPAEAAVRLQNVAIKNKLSAAERQVAAQKRAVEKADAAARAQREEVARLQGQLAAVQLELAAEKRAREEAERLSADFTRCSEFVERFNQSRSVQDQVCDAARGLAGLVARGTIDLTGSFYMRLCDAVYNIPRKPSQWRFHPKTMGQWEYVNTRQVSRAALPVPPTLLASVACAEPTDETLSP